MRPIQRRARLIVGWLAGLASCSAPAAPTPSAASDVRISVDAARPGEPLEPVWAYYGYDEPNNTTAPEGTELLRTLAEMQPGPVFARTHFLFNSGDGTPALKWGSTNVYTEDAEGRPAYDYALLDAIMDATVQAGARPFFELGFMPQALSIQPEPYKNSDEYALDGGCFYPPRDYSRWGELVSAWAAHVKERYAGAEESWQWELWNEPDLPYWRGTFAEYARLYDYTEAALHAVLPKAPLGGPAVAGVRSSFFRQFLEHCATGTNAVTGETGTRLDLISFHAKGGVALRDGHVQMNLGNQLKLHDWGFTAVAAWPQFARTPIVISEADPDACAACPVSRMPANAYRTSPAYAAYVVAMMKRSLELSEQRGTNLRGVLSWAFTFPEAPYFAGYRELSTHGIHLPVLNAFKLLGRLRGARLPVTSTGALPLDEILASSVRERPDLDALATASGDRVEILVWNYHDDIVEAAPAVVTLDVALPPAVGTRVRVSHTRVDSTHGDAFSAWRSQGSPAAPSAQQLAELRVAMEPQALEAARVIDAIDGGVSLSFELPRFGLSLVTLEPAAEGELATAPTDAAVRGDTGCAIARLSVERPAAPAVPLWLPVALVLALARRRRYFCP